jgi:hypothetical protein
MTIRYGTPHRYHVHDIDAASLLEATRIGLDHFPDADVGRPDLVEIRLHADPDDRHDAPEG